MMTQNRPELICDCRCDRMGVVLSMLIGCVLTSVVRAESPFDTPQIPTTTETADSQHSAVVPVRVKNARYWEGKQQALKESLEQPVELVFIEDPLLDVLEKLAEMGNTSVVVNEIELENLGIELNAQVTASLKDVPMRAALDQVLGAYDLTYYSQDGRLFVTSFEDAACHLVTRHYRVRDLLCTRAAQESVDQLQSLLIDAVDSDSWECHGGSGTISHYQGVLIVTQTDRLQDKIATIIESLRSEVSECGGPTLYEASDRRSDRNRFQPRTDRRAPSPNRRDRE